MLLSHPIHSACKPPASPTTSGVVVTVNDGHSFVNTAANGNCGALGSPASDPSLGDTQLLALAIDYAKDEIPADPGVYCRTIVGFLKVIAQRAIDSVVADYPDHPCVHSAQFRSRLCDYLRPILEAADDEAERDRELDDPCHQPRRPEYDRYVNASPII